MVGAAPKREEPSKPPPKRGFVGCDNHPRLLAHHPGVGREPDGLRDFVAQVSPRLLRSAYLLTGELSSAEDLVQGALLRAWRHWGRIQVADQPEAYVRRILVNEFLGNRRRRWAGELPGEVPEHAELDPGYVGVENREQLRAALDDLPRGQRTVVVLRYFDDLTEQQTADALGLTVGTVKSQCARALARMRVTLYITQEAR